MEQQQVIDSDGAAAIVALAQTNQEQLWRRRQIAWRINFAIWTAAVVAPAYIFAQDNAQITLGSWWFAFVCFLFSWLWYAWHLIQTYLSDEIDIEWMHYYKQQAEARLGVRRPEECDIRRPDKLTKLEVFLRPKTRKKYLIHAMSTLVTLAFMAVGLSLLWQTIKW